MKLSVMRSGIRDRQILIARELEYLDGNKSQLLTDKIDEVSRMLNALNQKLKAVHRGYPKVSLKGYTSIYP